MTKLEILDRNLGGEKLLWSQSPHPVSSFKIQNLIIFVWGIIWTSLVFWISSQPSKNGSNFDFFKYVMVAFGIIFTLASFSGVIRAVFSIYGITDKRLLIVRKYPWSVKLESFFNQDIEFVKKVKRNDGSGDVVFKTIKVRSGRGYRDTDIGFFGVDDVDSVEGIIIQYFRNNTK